MPLFLYSQEDSISILKGRVLNSENKPLSFAHIWLQNKANGTITNIHGDFEIEVTANDEVVISSLGYKTQKASLPSSLPKQIFKSFILQKDTIKLAETTIRPWPATYSKLKEKITSMDFEDRYSFDTQNKFLQKEMATAQRLAKRNIGIPPVTISGPISLLYAAFGDKPKQMRQLPKDKTRMSREAIINSKLNFDLIREVTKMNNQDSINSFIAFCNFGEEYLVQVDEYDLILELKNKFDDFMNVKNTN